MHEDRMKLELAIRGFILSNLLFVQRYVHFLKKSEVCNLKVIDLSSIKVFNSLYLIFHLILN